MKSPNHTKNEEVHNSNAEKQLMPKHSIKNSYALASIMFITVVILIIATYNINEASKTTKNRLLSQQSKSIIVFLDQLLDLVSSMANTLKIIFQLTALLFIITDLVNFWNLASIYIFLPIQIPKFAKEILQNVWTQFNLPILSFFNVSFDTITFKQKSTDYSPQEEYLSALELDISEIAFEPLFVLFMTGIELIFLTILLKWIKKSFRKLRDHVSKGIKLEDVYMKTLPLQSNGEVNQKGFNFFEMLLKNNKITPLNEQKAIKEEKSPQNCSQQMQQSMKNIFNHENSSIITEHIKMDQKGHQIIKTQKNCQPQQPFVHPQLKLMFMIHKIAQNKINSSQRKLKSQKHWSQTISIDQFQILSALLISFMPVMFLPLFGAIKNMQYRNLMEKVNDLIYILIISVLFIYPFVYLTAKLNVSRKRKHVKKERIVQKKNISKNKQNKPKKQKNLTQINLKQQVFQTFYMFFMNITIPVTVSIRSNPVIFLSVNLMVHLLLVASSIIFYRKKSCKSKLQKYNKIIQQFTFLLYHLCFCFVHVFSQVKENLLQNDYIALGTLDQIDEMMGVMIVGFFALGGLHEMLEFLVKIIYTLFKLIYMLLHVICGGYDIKELEEDMKRYSKAMPLQKLGDNKASIQPFKKQTIMVRDQKESAPNNTNRSLSQLGMDFQIEIAKNEIIVNKMKLQLLKEQKKLNSINIDGVSQIHLQQVSAQGKNTISSQHHQNPLCNTNLFDKMASTGIQKNQILMQNKQNLMAQSFPLKVTQKPKKMVKRSHIRPDCQLQVKNTQN